MRRITVLIMMAALLALSMPVSAATVAYWDMADAGAVDQAYMPGNAERADLQSPAGFGPEDFVISSMDLSGNGNHLSAWTSSWMKWSATSFMGDFAMEATNIYPDSRTDSVGSQPAGIDLDTWSPHEWTVECVFQATAGTNRTLVGRIGYQLPGAANQNIAAFYLAERGGAAINCEYVDVTGAYHNAISAGSTLVAGTWYHAAAVSDGTTLNLYLRDLAASAEWTIVASADLSGSADSSIIVDEYVESAFATNGGSWTVACGTYANGTGDRFVSPGKIDMVAISDTALAPSQFVFVAGVVATGILNDSPANNATLIPVARTASENDLVFTVFDPNIADVEVYLSANDPNAADLIKTITSVGTGQQTVTLETELASDLSFETDYYWKVIGYEPNTVIPANGNDVVVAGSVWHFTTAPETPLITVNPSAYTAVDAGEPNIVLVADGINGDLQWYKDGSPVIDAGGVYAGSTTNTLTIYDVQLADEGYYTLKVTNLAGEAESTPARVMIHRQTSYYDFDSITTLPDGNDVFVDSIDGYNAVLMQEAASAGWPTSVSDANSIPGLGAYLYLNNEDNAVDPNGQYLQIYPGVVDYEDLTISFWVQSTYVSIWQRILDFGNGTPDYLFITPDFGSGYDPRFSMRINGGGEQRLQPDLNSGNWIGPGTGWHFVAVTIGGNTGKMYIDGEWYVTNTGMTVNPIDVGAVVNYIGKSQYNDPEFGGYIDDLKIYNYARTNEQIGQDYLTVTDPAGSVCDTENNDVWRYDQGWEVIPGDPSSWIGGNNNCKIDLPDFAGMAARWLEADQFYPAP